MATLFAKHKTNPWQEIDRTNPDSDYTEQEQMKHMEGEYRECFGQAYLFKWEDVGLVEHKRK